MMMNQQKSQNMSHSLYGWWYDDSHQPVRFDRFDLGVTKCIKGIVGIFEVSLYELILSSCC